VLEDVLNKIDREELVHLARELVRIPSVSRPEEPDGNEARVARFASDYLERAGFEVKTEEVAPGRPNVWAVWEGDRQGKTLLFEAHTDVVATGAGDREIPHHADEWVDEEELFTTCKLYAATAMYYAYGEEAHV